MNSLQIRIPILISIFVLIVALYGISYSTVKEILKVYRYKELGKFWRIVYFPLMIPGFVVRYLNKW